MTILVDMDDTLEQQIDAWVRGVNAAYGYRTKYEDVRDWDVTRAFPGLTRAEVYGIPAAPGFWKTVKPVPGAAKALRHFLADGHTVYIVTAAQYETLAEKMDDVLFKYFPFLTWEQVIVTANKQLLKGDVLIDDGVHNLIGGDYAKILMTAPHNRDFDAEAHGMVRVNNWAEAEEAVRRLAEGR